MNDGIIEVREEIESERIVQFGRAGDILSVGRFGKVEQDVVEFGLVESPPLAAIRLGKGICDVTLLTVEAIVDSFELAVSVHKGAHALTPGFQYQKTKQLNSLVLLLGGSGSMTTMGRVLLRFGGVEDTRTKSGHINQHDECGADLAEGESRLHFLSFSSWSKRV